MVLWTLVPLVDDRHAVVRRRGALDGPPRDDISFRPCGHRDGPANGAARCRAMGGTRCHHAVPDHRLPLRQHFFHADRCAFPTRDDRRHACGHGNGQTDRAVMARHDYSGYADRLGGRDTLIGHHYASLFGRRNGAVCAPGSLGRNGPGAPASRTDWHTHADGHADWVANRLCVVALAADWQSVRSLHARLYFLPIIRPPGKCCIGAKLSKQTSCHGPMCPRSL